MQDDLVPQLRAYTVPTEHGPRTPVLVLRAAAEIVRLQALVEEAALQIEYLQGKFGETGTGNAVLTRLRAPSGWQRIPL